MAAARDYQDTRNFLKKVRIVGVYTTAQADMPDKTSDDLLFEAISGAAEDAGLSLDDIDGIAGGRSPTASNATGFPGYWSEMLGHSIRYHSNSDTAAAGHCANIMHGALAVAAGIANTVVVVGGGSRGGSRAQRVANLAQAHGEFDASWGTLVPSWFAMVARRHMHVYGTTSEQLAQIAVSTRAWATMSPQAMKRDPITVADVVNSRMISDPLHLLDCCLTNDGAGALIITTADRAKDCAKQPIHILGGAEDYTFRGYVDVCHDWLASGATHTGRHALEMAGLTHKDIDFLEIYDCFTITVLRELEDLGFCKLGEGGAFVADGKLGPGGSLPTNTHGGGLSWGHAFSGLAHAIEGVRQLRGECGERQVKGANATLVHSQGGPVAMHSTVIISNAN